MDVEAVEFTSDDGVVLRGQCHGEGPAWVILIHDRGQDLDAWADLPLHLWRSGLAVLIFDLRGHGLSDDPWRTEAVVADVRAALDFVQGRGASRRMLVGAGLGAAAAALAAGQISVEALVYLSPRIELTGWEEGVRHSTAPKFILVGATDRQALQEAERVQRLSLGWTALSTFGVREQGTDLLCSSWGSHVRDQIVQFLGDYRFPV